MESRGIFARRWWLQWQLRERESMVKSCRKQLETFRASTDRKQQRQWRMEEKRQACEHQRFPVGIVAGSYVSRRPQDFVIQYFFILSRRFVVIVIVVDDDDVHVVICTVPGTTALVAAVVRVQHVAPRRACGRAVGEQSVLVEVRKLG